MSKPLLTDTGDYEAVSLREALESRYLAYALSTITNRALPDVRDGLKPVHRRLLFAMRQLKLDPDQGFKKCARVVGDVIGRYHPHGDQAVYDALVRLAQSFAVRYPLVDGQGNFGNVDGDGAAAMRYTEARMTDIGRRLLRDIEFDTVDFRPTYDGEDEEPVILPAAFPNLLANGASGIAVGMATNIPPHNIGELCAAALHLIKTPGARITTLMEYIKGPDFPTGGIIVETPQSLQEIYESGRGSVRLRARYEVERLAYDKWQIVVTEIPYQIQKSRLIEKIAEMIQARTLSMLDDIRDESAEDIRLVLIPKSRNIDAEQLMSVLFRQTDLEIRFSVNFNVLNADSVPGVMGLRELLLAWLDHRKVVLKRKTTFRLNKIATRLEILSGYLIAYLNLDEIIRIIREEDEPRPHLMKTFSLTEVQADAILNMRLRALRKLEEMSIREEHKALKKEQTQLKKLLKSDDLQWQSIAADIRQLKKDFTSSASATSASAASAFASSSSSAAASAAAMAASLGKRRTQFAEPVPDDTAPIEMSVEKEPITVICSQKGWIRAMRGHIENGAELKYKTGDRHGFVLHAQTTDKLVLLAGNGRAYMLDAARLPGGRGHGEPLNLMIDLADMDSIVEIFPYQPERKLLLASHAGFGFVIAESNLAVNRRAGRQVLNLAPDDRAVCCVPVDGDQVAVLGENRKLLCFAMQDLPEMARGKGVRLQKYNTGGLADIRCYDSRQGLAVTDKQGRVRHFDDLADWQGQRAQSGRVRPKGFPADGRMGLAFANRL